MRTKAPAKLVTALPDLPATVVSKDRQTVDLSRDIWQFRVSDDGGRLITIKWGLLDQDISPGRLSVRARELYKLFLARKFQFSKGNTIRNDFETLRRFFRWLKSSNQPSRGQEFSWGILDHTIFRLFLEHGMSTGERGIDFIRLRDFYSWGAFVGQYPEFDRQLALSIKAIRAKGSVRGAVVRFRHPAKGPLDKAELRIVIEAIRSGVGTPEDRALVMIHLELGPNQQSVARLRTGDIKKFEVETVDQGRPRTHTRYHVSLPRVKKRKEYRETVVRPISNELGSLLETLKSDQPDSFLFHWLNPDYPERAIFKAMQRFATAGKLISSRTGLRLQLNPRRFRYTLATEMAREGTSPEKIAGALDHTDLQSVKVYIETSSYVIDQMGDAFDAVFEPFARSFLGKVVDHGELGKSTIKILPSSSPLIPILDIGGIGSCGRDIRADGLCKLAPPLTCYACQFFAAFRDGPHTEVLLALENLQTELRTSSDIRIPMQFDDVISAARQLVAQIQAESHEARK